MAVGEGRARFPRRTIPRGNSPVTITSAPLLQFVHVLVTCSDKMAQQKAVEQRASACGTFHKRTARPRPERAQYCYMHKVRGRAQVRDMILWRRC